MLSRAATVTGTDTVNSHPTITFPEPGICIVKMFAGSGSFFGWSNYANTPAYAYAMDLLEIQQWGNTKWTYLSQAFRNSINMDVTATDIPDLISNGIQPYFIEGIFWNCPSLKNTNGSISNWNTSNITNMNTIFYGDSSFNQPLNNWDVSKVTNMGFMFAFATQFNQPLNNWNVGNVTNMSAMFYGAKSFNQPLNNWDVSKVTNMAYMFEFATQFNQSLNNWNVSNVTNTVNMFESATQFNQPLNSWNVGNVTNMSGMFYGASAFNQNIGSWNLSSVTTIDSMLNNSGLSSINYASSLEGWAANSNTPDSLNLGAYGLSYATNAQSAHDTLTSTNGWTISDNGIGFCCTLPITLVSGSFHAVVQNSTVLLSWATATEINNKGFGIQRSTDGLTWSTISFVNSQAAGGNSTKTVSYKFIDTSPVNGENFYRLMQTDKDGHTTPTGNVVRVNVSGAKSGLTVYPNPAHDSITISGLHTGSKVAVYATGGQAVKRFTSTAISQKIDISTLAAGIYFIRTDNSFAKFIVR